MLIALIPFLIVFAIPNIDVFSSDDNLIVSNDDSIIIDYGKDYDVNKISAKTLFDDYSDKVVVKTDLDTSKVGKYIVNYELQFGLFKIKNKKVVEVVDRVKPVINLEGKEKESVCPNQEYKESGFKAIDEYDGDITDKVEIDNKDKNKIIYTVSDNSGNKEEVYRELVYEDKEKPSIKLNGSSEVTVYVGNSYTDSGYSATDSCDGDLTKSVKVTNTVDTNKVGSYTVKYEVSDKAGNNISVERKVSVINRPVYTPPSNGGSGKGIVYLTFDDGPNEGTTNVILDVLKEEGVSATFFVTCNGPDYLIKRMYNEGHTVALHTATHDYSTVYSSENAYFADLDKVSNRVERLTGVKSKIIRFPGGSSNTISRRYNAGIMTRLTQRVKERGYHYFDWNVDSNDAAGAGTNGVYSNVVNNISLNRENVVLMHDIKIATRDAIRSIIRYGKNNGFTFRKITYDTAMVTHAVNN